MIWLVGNKGMLGNDIENCLAESKLNYIASDNEVDITKKESISDFLANKKLDYIINASGYTDVDGAQTEKDKAYRVNSEGVENLANAARRKDAVIIHFSTDYIFSGRKSAPYTEEDNTEPLSIYGKSKLAGERKIQSICRKYFIIRLSWLYGSSGGNFVKTMVDLFRTQNEVRVVNDQTGCPTYTEDAAKVTADIIKNKEDKYGIYHYSNAGPLTWFEFAGMIYEICLESNIVNRKVNIKPVSSKDYLQPARRPGYSVMSKDKIRDIIGAEIVSGRKSLKKFLLKEYR